MYLLNITKKNRSPGRIFLQIFSHTTASIFQIRRHNNGAFSCCVVGKLCWFVLSLYCVVYYLFCLYMYVAYFLLFGELFSLCCVLILLCYGINNTLCYRVILLVCDFILLISILEFCWLWWFCCVVAYLHCVVAYFHDVLTYIHCFIVYYQCFVSFIVLLWLICVVCGVILSFLLYCHLYALSWGLFPLCFHW